MIDAANTCPFHLHPLILLHVSFPTLYPLNLCYVFFFWGLLVQATSKIRILYQISVVVESEWKKVGRGRWIEAFEELGRQHQDGMGWDGTDPPQKTEKYFSVRFKRRASASVVA